MLQSAQQMNYYIIKIFTRYITYIRRWTEIFNSIIIYTERERKKMTFIWFDHLTHILIVHYYNIV